MVKLRKVQRTPTGTFFVCLPRSWAEKHELKKGAVVALDEISDGRLFINAEVGVEQLPRIAALSPGPYLGREIIGCYLLGFDVIRVEAKERFGFDVRAAVKQAIGSLIGLEIVEETSSLIVLRCLLAPSGFPPEELLQRNYAIAVGMSRDAVSSLVTGDLQLAKSVIARDDEGDRQYFLLVRVLRTIIQDPGLGEKLGVTPVECMDYRLAASFVEGVGDASTRVAAGTLELGGVALSGELRRLLAGLQVMCSESTEKAVKAFVEKNVALAEEVQGIRGKVEAVLADVEKVAKDQPVEVMLRVLAAVSYLRRIYEFSVDLADLVV
jgi:phosphate uptake regulator